MKLLILSLAFFTLNSAFASYNQAPPAFAYKTDRAVFIDFEEAYYDITYDFTNKVVQVEANIIFNAAESGFPIFDKTLFKRFWLRY